MTDTDLHTKLKALVGEHTGGSGKPSLAPDPVNQPMIRHCGAAARNASPIDPPRRPTPRIVSWRGIMGYSEFTFGRISAARRIQFHDAERIEIQRRNLSIRLSQCQPVEPELVVFAVGKPASGLLLLKFDDGAGRFAAPGIIAGGDLLHHLHLGAGNKLLADRFVHSW